MNQESFSKLTYDVSKPGLLIENYPELKDYPQTSNPEDDLYLKLVVLITDQNSPFIVKNKNFPATVYDACDYLKISDTDFIERIVSGYHNEETVKVFNMQSFYFRLFNNFEYENWYTMIVLFHKNGVLIRTGADPDDKRYEEKMSVIQKVMAEHQTLLANINKYEQMIFPLSTNSKRVITKQVAKITNWPERMAKGYSAPQ